VVAIRKNAGFAQGFRGGIPGTPYVDSLHSEDAIRNPVSLLASPWSLGGGWGSGGFFGLVSSSPAGGVPQAGAKADAARRRKAYWYNRSYGRLGFIVRTFVTPPYPGSIYPFDLY